MCRATRLPVDSGQAPCDCKRCDLTFASSAGGGLHLSARQPLLRDRSPVGYRLVPVRTSSAGLAAGAGDLRLRPRSHHVRLRARPPTKTALDGYTERRGVCRDFAHLAITLCRCMNIPARYCTGYLGDIGVPLDVTPMDFSAWFEVYLGGHWYTFDARHNKPRIGRILMARGRDATDAAISTAFGNAVHTVQGHHRRGQVGRSGEYVTILEAAWTSERRETSSSWPRKYDLSKRKNPAGGRGFLTRRPPGSRGAREAAVDWLVQLSLHGFINLVRSKN